MRKRRAWDIPGRTHVIMCFLAGALAALTIIRLTMIMVIRGDFYQDKASDQQLYDTVLSPMRGDIYDTNMNILATSSTVWNVFVTPNSIRDLLDDEEKTELIDGLSALLSIDRATMQGYCEEDSSRVVIARELPQETVVKVRQFISDKGFGNVLAVEESNKRYYPNDSLASTVLGFVGVDNQGLYGIEAYYENELKGMPGVVVSAKNAAGADMPFNYEKKVEAVPGNSLVLTIDSYIQHVAEKYLEQAVAENNVTERGVCLVMDVNTGGLLACAVKGDFNPNEPFVLQDPADKAAVDALSGEARTKKLIALQNRQWQNKAVTEPYEPGSVFKIITGAAAIEEHVTDDTMSYNCPGYIVVAGQRYSCHKTDGHGTQTLENAFQNSCNPVFITFGQLLGVDTFSKYFEAFGLTKTTGIDLPGEFGSVYHSQENMGVVELASSSFGQTFTVTPVQLITAVSAAVNGGYLLQPHVVEQVLDADGNVVKTIEAVQKRQVISEATSEKICSLLEAVVSGGSGKNAYVAGYQVGGKTGTSEKVADELEAQNNVKLRISSFCGIAPTNAPQVAVLVMLDEPHADNVYGGTIAAPVGGQVLADILPYLGVQANYTEDESSALIRVPDVGGDSIDSAVSEIESAGLDARVIGEGETVLSQNPGAGHSVTENGTVVLYTEEGDTHMSVVPNFAGQSLSTVNSLAADNNLNVVYSGANLTTAGVVAYKQSIDEGVQVESGTVVTVYFRSEDSSD